MKSHKIKKTVFVLFCLAATNFCQLILIDEIILKWFNLISALFILFLGLDFMLKNMKSNKILNLFYLGIIISIFSAYVFRGQDIITSLIAIRAYYFLMIFYLIIKWELDWRFVKSCIIVLGLIYATAYFINYFTYPDILFGDHSSERRGTISTSFQGIAFGVMGFIFLLNSFLKNSSIKNLIPLIYIGLAFILRAGRTNLIAIFIISVFMIFSQNRITRKSLFSIFVIVLSFAGLYYYFDYIFIEMFSQTEEQTSRYDEDVRYLAALFYINEFSPNIFSLIFGNGYPSAASAYGQYQTGTLWDRGIYAEDVGFIGFWAYFGIITLFSFGLMLIKYLKSESTEIKSFGLFLIVTAFTTYNFYQPDYLLLEGILLVFALSPNSNNHSLVDNE